MNDELLYFDIYGCKVEDIDLVKDQMEEVLGIKMRERESTFYGRYFRYSNELEEIDCKRNWNHDEEEILFEEYREYPMLVFISGTLRPEEFERKLKTSQIHFTLLKRAQA